LQSWQSLSVSLVASAHLHSTRNPPKVFSNLWGDFYFDIY
jgi:hypothetical protein